MQTIAQALKIVPTIVDYFVNTTSCFIAVAGHATLASNAVGHNLGKLIQEHAFGKRVTIHSTTKLLKW